jgi:hypothetical protein
VTEDQFEREKRYQLILAIARKMVRDGVLSAGDLTEIEGMMREKYRPVFCVTDPKIA